MRDSVDLPDLADLADRLPICTGPKPLPDHLLAQGSRIACAVNPANAVSLAALGLLSRSGGPVLNPAHAALLTSKYWGVGGVHLTVSFLESVPLDFQQHVLSHMNAWSQYGNIGFSLAPAGSTGQVRITVVGNGYWSYLGTDILAMPRTEPTMCLQGFQKGMPESEYKRVVRHETGHCLGMPHEHSRPEIVALLDPAKTIAYFERTQGWSAQMIQEQILTPLRSSDLTALAADVQSIMAYQFPGACTKSGQPIPGGLDIDSEDAQLIGRLYPKASHPVTPAPPPTPPPAPPPTDRVQEVYQLLVSRGWPPGAWTLAMAQWLVQHGYAQPQALDRVPYHV